MDFKQSWVLSQILWRIPTHPPQRNSARFNPLCQKVLTIPNPLLKEFCLLLQNIWPVLTDSQRNSDQSWPIATKIPANPTHFCRKSDQSQSHSYHLRSLVGYFLSRSHPWTIAINQLLKNGLNRPKKSLSIMTMSENYY